MPERIDKKDSPLVFRDLGVLEYNRALALQIDARERKIADPALPDPLFFVEHPPVFTLGKNGGRENLMVSDDFLDHKDVAVIQTDRGGNITYHGPGQAVLYPVIDLEKAKIGVADFVYGLEEIMQQITLKYGIQADRNARNHGLWVGSRKIGSVGLAIKRGVSIHGLALNVKPDLTPFSWINPCGMENVPITSVKAELKAAGRQTEVLSMDEIRDDFVTCFCRLFGFKSVPENAHV